jgi:hypothetical protein
VNVNAELPKSIETVTLADMPVGMTAYTVPWAMYADQDRKLWLDPNFTFERKSGGTVQMRVTRLDEGFRVGYVPGETYEPGNGRASDKDGLPVVALTGAPEADDTNA